MICSRRIEIILQMKSPSTMIGYEDHNDSKVTDRAARDRSNLYIRWSAAILGMTAAVCVWIWPNHAFFFQEVLYSTLILGLILYAVSIERHKSRYWGAWLSVLVLHSIVLWIIKPLFPFHSIWIIAAIALVECSALALIFLKIVGE